MSRVAAFFYSRHLPSPPFALLTAMANASQKCLHPKCDVKHGDLNDGDAASLGDWMGFKGGALNLIDRRTELSHAQDRVEGRAGRGVQVRRLGGHGGEGKGFGGDGT